MSAMSDYLENKLVDLVFRGGSFTPPATVYVAALTAAPNDSGGGTEVTGSGYARVAVSADAAHWKSTQGDTSATSTGNSGTTTNVLDIVFPTPGGAWGTITHVEIYDALTGGNLLFFGILGTARTVTDSGTPLSFPAGSLAIQFDN